MDYDWYLKKVSGGGWRDIRYRHGGGDTVWVISGAFEGLLGTVDSVVCQKSYDYPDEVSPGYHITHEDGRWVTFERVPQRATSALPVPQ